MAEEEEIHNRHSRRFVAGEDCCSRTALPVARDEDSLEEHHILAKGRVVGNATEEDIPGNSPEEDMVVVSVIAPGSRTRHAAENRSRLGLDRMTW